MSQWASAGFAGPAGQSSQGQASARATEEPGAMRVAAGILWLLALGGPLQAWGACPSQCSCSLHVLGDGSKARYGTRCAGAQRSLGLVSYEAMRTRGSLERRTVVCNDPDMTLPPASVPLDTSSLRLERTAIRRLNALMLRGLRRLRELRMPGNRLATFPWAALRDAPKLRLLDLQANRLSAVPPEAARFLGNLTFLDLSSNQLLRLPEELLATWTRLQTGPFLPGHHAKLVLGLQDNPWVCDCRLYDLVRLLEGWAPNLAFMEARLRCASPRSLAGVAFSQLELKKCQSPELRPGAASISSPLGSAVLLRYYICQAKNFLGASETLISLVVSEPQTSTEHSGGPVALWARTGEGAEAAAYNKMVARHVPHIPEPAVVGDTYQSVTLVWKAPQAGNTTSFSVLYAVFGQRDMQRVVVQPGKTSVTIHGLVPKIKYVACVCVQGLVPRKEQCVIFSTDEVVDAEATQWLINVVVISVATIIALPLTLLVCCGALQSRWRKCHTRGSAEATGAYVNLERLGHSEDGSEELSQHCLSEADRLLSAHSSLDSQALGVRAGRRINELRGGSIRTELDIWLIVCSLDSRTRKKKNMASVSHYFLLVLVFLDSHAAQPSCLPGCTCSEESFGRTLQCVSITLGKIPRKLPEEFKQVRIENSPLFELPRGSFINMSTLEYLWLNFNNVTVIHLGALEHLSELKELRLEGNELRSVPWTAFRATPLLRVLDLKHNRIDALPELALQFLVNLTYLDLSSNRLTVVAKSVFLNWPAYQKHRQPGCGAEILSSMVLALHDNPWLCDCRLRGLVQFVKSISLPVVLVNPYLMCRGPLSKAGQLFHETELSACMKPQISTPSANVSIRVGQNVTLRCLVQASPSPTIAWTYPLSTWREFDVLTSSTAEDAALSELVIPAAHLVDRGSYTCVASNSIGRSTCGNAYVDLRVVKQTVRGIVLEWFVAADTPEKWFTLYIGSDEALRKEVVHVGPGISTYLVDDLLPGTKYEVCLSLGRRPPRQGRCVVFVTGRDHGGLEGRERLLHTTVILCAVLLATAWGTEMLRGRGSRREMEREIVAREE
ncbi:hypothetical protein E2I00_006665, partial [Balaenoptera physalus]